MMGWITVQEPGGKRTRYEVKRDTDGPYAGFGWHARDPEDKHVIDVIYGQVIGGEYLAHGWGDKFVGTEG